MLYYYTNLYFFHTSRKEVSIISKFFNIFYILLFLITIFSCIFFIPTYSLNSNLLWPAPNYYKINSPFGKRIAPTTGASTYHKGIDIGAPEGSSFIAVTNGTITYVGFLGGGGYTITLTDKYTTLGEIKYSYCHCNPNFIVSIGDIVYKGQIIGKVGPKYIDNIEGNQYKDSNGKQTNGATTGPHLHFGMRINGEYVNPLDYLPYYN